MCVCGFLFVFVVVVVDVFGVLYACVLYICICTFSAGLSMFHIDRRSRNTLIIIIVIINGKSRPLEGLFSKHLAGR